MLAILGMIGGALVAWQASILCGWEDAATNLRCDP